MMFLVLGGTHANALTFGKEVVIAASPPGTVVDHRLQKLFAILIITLVCQLQAFSRIMNIRVHNALAAYKIALLLFISVTGWVAIAGKRSASAAAADRDKDFGESNLSEIFKGNGASPYAYSLAMLNVIRAFLGYENANFVSGIVYPEFMQEAFAHYAHQVLEEVQKPEGDRMRTFRRAVKLSVVIVCFLYMMVNVAFVSMRHYHQKTSI
jgi:amino acid transporter